VSALGRIARREPLLFSCQAGVRAGGPARSVVWNYGLIHCGCHLALLLRFPSICFGSTFPQSLGLSKISRQLSADHADGRFPCRLFPATLILMRLGESFAGSGPVRLLFLTLSSSKFGNPWTTEGGMVPWMELSLRSILVSSGIADQKLDSSGMSPSILLWLSRSSWALGRAGSTANRGPVRLFQLKSTNSRGRAGESLARLLMELFDRSSRRSAVRLLIDSGSSMRLRSLCQRELQCQGCLKQGTEPWKLVESA